MVAPALKTDTYQKELGDLSKLLPLSRLEWILRDCKNALHAATEPNELALWFHVMGLAHAYMGKYRESLDDFRNASHYNPSNNDHKISMSAAMLNLDMPAEALEVLADLVDVTRHQMLYVVSHAAEALADLGHVDEAILAFNEVLQIANHSDPQEVYLLAVQAAEIGADREAVELFARYVSLKLGQPMGSQTAVDIISSAPEDVYVALKRPFAQALHAAVLRARSLEPLNSIEIVVGGRHLPKSDARDVDRLTLDVFNDMRPLRLAANAAVLGTDEHAS